MVASFALAYLTYRFIEKPIRFGRRKRRSAALLLPALFAAGCVGFVLQSGAVAPRLETARSRAAAEAHADWETPGGYLTGDGLIAVHFIPGDSSRTVLVIGDSHAEQYWPRFVELARERAQRFPKTVFLTYGGCQPLPSVNYIGGSSWQDRPWRCDTLFERALSYAARPEIRTVVLAGFWEDFRNRYDVRNSRKTDLTLTGPEADRIFAELAVDLRELVREGKRVFVVLSNPSEDSLDPVAQLNRINIRQRDRRPLHVLYRSKAAAAVRDINQKLRTAASTSGAVAIDPIEFLCNPTTCPTSTPDGTPIYRDKHHLRASYVRNHVTYLDRVVE